MDLKTDFKNQLAKNGVSSSPRADSFLDLIKTGSIKSGTTESDVRAMLDFSRSLVLDLSGKVRSLTKLSNDAMTAVRSAQATISRAKVSPAPAPARAATPAPAPGQPIVTTTASGIRSVSTIGGRAAKLAK
jgi:hypothetical protein